MDAVASMVGTRCHHQLWPKLLCNLPWAGIAAREAASWLGSWPLSSHRGDPRLQSSSASGAGHEDPSACPHWCGPLPVRTQAFYFLLNLRLALATSVCSLRPCWPAAVVLTWGRVESLWHTRIWGYSCPKRGQGVRWVGRRCKLYLRLRPCSASQHLLSSFSAPLQGPRPSLAPRPRSPPASCPIQSNPGLPGNPEPSRLTCLMPELGFLPSDHSDDLRAYPGWSSTGPSPSWALRRDGDAAAGPAELPTAQCPLCPRTLAPALWQGPSRWPKWIWNGLPRLTSFNSANEVSPAPILKKDGISKMGLKTLLLVLPFLGSVLQYLNIKNTHNDLCLIKFTFWADYVRFEYDFA